jgi:uncharacterized protein YdeI (YjbR/CyaY-like superfamily)
MQIKTDYPMRFFASQKEWESWLSQNHDKENGVWLRFYKKNSGVVSLTYDQALEEALCYGWIDSQAKSYDEKSYLQKFTPRRSKSIWSKINTGHIERLMKEGRMKTAGMLQVEAAKKDGRWQSAYAPQNTIVIPNEFMQELKKNQKAFTFFETLNKSNKYAIAFRLTTAKKEETKKKRIKDFIAMLSRGEKFH